MELTKEWAFPIYSINHMPIAHCLGLICTSHFSPLPPEKRQCLTTWGLWANEFLVHLFIQLTKATTAALVQHPQPGFPAKQHPVQLWLRKHNKSRSVFVTQNCFCPNSTLLWAWTFFLCLYSNFWYSDKFKKLCVNIFCSEMGWGCLNWDSFNHFPRVS